MQPLGYRISYRSTDAEKTSVERSEFRSFWCSDFDLLVDWSGELIELSIEAHARVELTGLRLRFAHDFTRESILMNGYQSWTDTREFSSRSIMPGIKQIPRGIVAQWVLDGGGDYKFVDYTGRPGHLHGFTYAVFGNADSLVLLASLDERGGFTLISTDPQEKTVTIAPELPARPLEAGERRLIGRFVRIEAEGDDARERAYDRWFELSGIKPRPAAPLIGYSSWYRHYDDIDVANILGDLAGVVEAFSTPELKVLGSAGGFDALRPCFQIDDGWCEVGDWLCPDSERFPHGMWPIAGDAKAAGFVPGLWMAPFVCSVKSRLYADHPDWLLRDEAGNEIRTGSHWEGAVALDTLNPEVRAYAAECVRTAVESWGFGLLKLDFLYAACMITHGGMNRGELMADAFDIVREAAGEALILACGVPLGSVFGKADYCRVGCDVGLDWDDKPHMRLLHRERVSTKKSLKDARARSPLDGRAFGADPDIVFLREDVKLTKDQRELMLDTAATCGSVLLTSDDMASWTSGQRKRFASVASAIVERKARRNEDLGKAGR